MTSSPTMLSHDEVEAEGWIDLYCQGRLAEEMELRFEEHLLTCPPCQEQLETARSLRRGLKSLAARETERAAVTLAVAGTLAKGRRLVWLGLVAVLLVGALAPTVWLQRERARLEVELAQQRDQLDRATATGRALAEELAEDLAAERSASAAERELLEEQIAAIRRQEAVSPGLQPKPQADLPIFLLSVMRGDPAGTPFEIPSGQALTLAIDVGDEPNIQSYRLRLLDSSGTERWAQDELQPTVLEAVLLTVPADWLDAGAYTLIVDALTLDGRYVEQGRFAISARP